MTSDSSECYEENRLGKGGVAGLEGPTSGTSLAVQWLRLHTSTAGGVGLILGRGNKIPQAAWHGQKKNNNNTKEGPTSDTAVKEGLLEEITLKLRPEGLEGASCGRAGGSVLQAEERASAKALGWDELGGFKKQRRVSR